MCRVPVVSYFKFVGNGLCLRIVCVCLWCLRLHLFCVLVSVLVCVWVLGSGCLFVVFLVYNWVYIDILFSVCCYETRRRAGKVLEHFGVPNSFRLPSDRVS